MTEPHLYNLALLIGIGILLTGLVIHSWAAIALGALIAGIGGTFGVFSTSKRD